MGKLPDCTIESMASDDSIASYRLLLEQVLEDRSVDEVEAKQLHELAISLGLDGPQVAEVHRCFLKTLGSIVMADHALSPSEKRDYLRVAQLLAVTEEQAMKYLAVRNDEPAVLTREDLSGNSVCFTGESQCTIDGQRIDKERAEELATAAGMTFAKSVTKKLDILVVADPDTMSGKAKKARDYGKRIVAERAFWPKIGLRVD